MPHSPRFYQGKLWLHNSGKGDFGYVDLDKGEFVPVTFCPGYLRGMAFHNNFAIVGLSKSRQNKSFSSLAFNQRLEQEKISPRCGILIIDLNTGDIVHSLNLEGVVIELFDVVTLVNKLTPMAIGFKNEEIRRVITIGES